jgi:hypothetical protein
MKYEYNKWYNVTIARQQLKCSSEWKAPRPAPLNYHRGIDFAKSGTVGIFSATDGVVEKVTWDTASNGGFGLYVKVKIGTGKYLYYAHLKNAMVMENERINEGDRIGTMGNTGNSTGQHIHFEYRVLGVPKDPTNFLIVNPMDDRTKEAIQITRERFPDKKTQTDEQVLDFIRNDGRQILRLELKITDTELWKKNIIQVILDNKDILGMYFRTDFPIPK